MPRLAARRATGAALALQTSDGDVDAAVEAYFRDRDEVKIAESLCTRAHTLCTLALLVHVPVHTCKTHATLQHAHAIPHAAGGRALLRVLGRPLRRGRVALAPQR